MPSFLVVTRHNDNYVIEADSVKLFESQYEFVRGSLAPAYAEREEVVLVSEVDSITPLTSEEQLFDTVSGMVESFLETDESTPDEGPGDGEYVTTDPEDEDGPFVEKRYVFGADENQWGFLTPYGFLAFGPKDYAKEDAEGAIETYRNESETAHSRGWSYVKSAPAREGK
jgi:hypothetical protein